MSIFSSNSSVLIDLPSQHSKPIVYLFDYGFNLSWVMENLTKIYFEDFSSIGEMTLYIDQSYSKRLIFAHRLLDNPGICVFDVYGDTPSDVSSADALYEFVNLISPGILM